MTFDWNEKKANKHWITNALFEHVSIQFRTGKRHTRLILTYFYFLCSLSVFRWIEQLLLSRFPCVYVQHLSFYFRLVRRDWCEYIEPRRTDRRTGKQLTVSLSSHFERIIWICCLNSKMTCLSVRKMVHSQSKWIWKKK